MNEAAPPASHYKIINRLQHDKGLISEGAILEFLTSHTAVVFQPDFDDKHAMAASTPAPSASR